MKLTTILFLYLFFAPLICIGQAKPVVKDPWKNTRDGNEFYQRTDYTEAEKKYTLALTTDTSKVVANYNLGNALYKQKKYSEAGKTYADGLGTNGKDSLNRGWYNLGNSLLQEKKYAESINAYKESLRNNPADENARYNLAYAQKMLESQKKKDQQNQQNSDGGDKDDKKKEQDKKDQDDKQDKKDKDQKDADQKKKQPDPKKQPMSPQEAKKMLDALKNEEQKTRQRINKNSAGSEYNRSKEKDW